MSMDVRIVMALLYYLTGCSRTGGLDIGAFPLKWYLGIIHRGADSSICRCIDIAVQDIEEKFKLDFADVFMPSSDMNVEYCTETIKTLMVPCIRAMRSIAFVPPQPQANTTFTIAGPLEDDITLTVKAQFKAEDNSGAFGEVLMCENTNPVAVKFQVLHDADKEGIPDLVRGEVVAKDAKELDGVLVRPFALGYKHGTLIVRLIVASLLAHL
jgi:hypothetical protein